MKKVEYVGCSDWQLGWGYGYTLIGKLYQKDKDGYYTWKGSSHGRHGQVWETGILCKFKWDDEDNCILEYVETNKSNRTPVLSELRQSINILKNNQ